MSKKRQRSYRTLHPLPTPTQVKNDQEYRLKWLAEGWKSFRWAAGCATVVASLYVVYKCVETASGKRTDFNAVLRVLADIRVSAFAYLSLVAVLSGFGYYNWRARKKAERAASRAAALEKTIDPKRSGSDLLPDGSNPPDDPS